MLYSRSLLVIYFVYSLFSSSVMSNSLWPHQTPLSVGFPRQEYWRGLPFPAPGDLPDPGIKPESPALQTDSSPLSHQGSPVKSNIE